MSRSKKLSQTLALALCLMGLGSSASYYFLEQRRLARESSAPVVSKQDTLAVAAAASAKRTVSANSPSVPVATSIAHLNLEAPPSPEPEALAVAQTEPVRKAEAPPSALLPPAAEKSESAPPAALAPPPASAAEEDSSPSGRLVVITGFEYTAISSTDKALGGTSTFLSDLSPKIVMGWIYEITASVSAFTNFSVLMEKVADDTASNPLEIKNAQGQRKGFEIGVQKTWTSGSATALSTGAKEQLYAYTPNNSTISMNRIPTGYLRISHDQTLFQKNKFSVFAGGKLDYLFESKDSVHKLQGGLATQVDFGFRQDYKKFTVETRAYYGTSRQNSNLVEQTERHLGGTMGFTMRFDP